MKTYKIYKICPLLGVPIPREHMYILIGQQMLTDGFFKCPTGMSRSSL